MMKLAQIFITPHQYFEDTIRVVGLLIVEKGEVGMCLMYYIKYDSRVLYVREVLLTIFGGLYVLVQICLFQLATALESNCHCLSHFTYQKETNLPSLSYIRLILEKVSDQREHVQQLGMIIFLFITKKRLNSTLQVNNLKRPSRFKVTIS